MNTLFLIEDNTLNDIFCIPSIIIICLLILVIPIASVIILLADRMSIPYILDSDADYQRRLRERERPRVIIDLSFHYMPDTVPNASGRPFVYDRLDPSGANMSMLFGTYSAEERFYYGRKGYLIGIRALRDDHRVVIKATTIQMALFERAGGTVLSNGTPIVKGVRDYTGTPLYVIKSQ